MRLLAVLAAQALLLAPTVGCRASKGATREVAPWSHEAGRRDARLHLARTLLENDQPKPALQVLAEARKETGPDVELDALQGEALLALGLQSEAEATLTPHMTRHRQHPDLLRVLGLLRFDQGRFEEGEKALARAARLAPSDARIRNNLGFLLMVDRRPDEAVSHLREAVRLEPGSTRYRNNLGFALAASGRDDEALAVFRSTGPEPLALSHMGIACERRGDITEAVDYYGKALALDAAQPLASSAMERLGSQAPQGDEP